MPTYTLKCKNCEHEFEHVMKMQDSKPECPKCQGETRNKIVSAPKVNFVGGGFYTTDSKTLKDGVDRSGNEVLTNRKI